MDYLSFEKMPHFIFGSNRQFTENEHHITRIYDMSVLLLMRKGVLRFTENGTPVELREGEYYIQKPGLLQEGVLPSDKPNYFFVHFKGHYGKGGSLPIRGRFDRKKIQSLIEEFNALGYSAEKLKYELIFYKILVTLQESIDTASTAEKMRTFLLENYSDALTLDKLTKISLLSKNQTINVFKDAYGMTPHKYLLQFRLKKASEMIIATNLSFKEICYAVGFSDYSNFFKLFTTEFGESPLSFRLKISNKKLSKDLYRFPEKTSGITFKDDHNYDT